MSVPVHEPIVLPTIAFLAAWNWQGLGTAHPVVGADETWATERIRGGIQERVLRGLTKSGLADHTGPKAPLRALLTLLAEADREFYGWLQPVEPASTTGVLVAAADDDAIALSVTQETVRLAPLAEDTLPGELAATLPEADPANIDPLRLTKSQYAPHDRASAPSSGRHAAPDPGDELATLLRDRQAGTHTLYTATSASDGSRMRSSPLTVIDLEGRGRVLTFLSDTASDDPTINCVPGTPESVANTLESAHHTLARTA